LLVYSLNYATLLVNFQNSSLLNLDYFLQPQRKYQRAAVCQPMWYTWA